MSSIRQSLRGVAHLLPGISRVVKERDAVRAELKQTLRFMARALHSDQLGRIEAGNPPKGGRGGSVADRTKRVVHINRTDFGGGAARIAYSLHRGVSHQWASRMVVDQKVSDDPNVFALGRNDPEFDQLLRRGAHEASLTGFVGHPADEWLSHPEILAADVLHLHNLHAGYFNHLSLPALAAGRKVIWTLHDEYAFTGHCASTLGCDGWMKGCPQCPHLMRYVELVEDSASELFDIKRRVYSQLDCDLVCPSEWLAKRVGSSILGNQRIHVIPNGVDTDVFVPGDRLKARSDLGLPLESKICLFVADGGLENPWKGSNTAKEVAASFVNDREFLFVEVGGNSPGDWQNWHRLGQVRSRERMRLCYQAADLLLYPTLADIHPLVVSEAMACGLPVIGSVVGGVPEIIEDQVTGLLIPAGGVNQFIEAIRRLVTDSNLQALLGSCARVVAKKKFSEEKMIHRYEALYETAIDRRVSLA